MELLEAKDALNKSKQELVASNEEIGASYNELAAVEEELIKNAGIQFDIFSSICSYNQWDF